MATQAPPAPSRTAVRRTGALPSHQRATPTPRSTIEPAQRPVDLTALHGLRIALTFWLVIHHLTRWLLRGTDIDPSTVAFLRQGQGATTGFFILSGVVLTSRYARRLALDPTIPNAAVFLRRRWAAVWPLGAIGVLLAIPYELVEDRLAPGEFVVGIGANLALVQSWLPVGGGIHGMALRFDGPTWTLSTLLALYAAFPVICLLVARIRTKAGLVALGVAPWFVIVGTGSAMVHEPNGVWMMHCNPLMRSADFLAGIAIGTWLLRHGGIRARTGWTLQLVGLAMLALTVVACVELHLPREVRFGAAFIPAFAVLITGMTVAAGPVRSVLASRPLQVAGKRAFAVAMVHTPLLGLGWHAGIVRLDNPVGVAATLTLIVLLAASVHQFVEMPVRSRLRQSWRTRRGAVAA